MERAERDDFAAAREIHAPAHAALDRELRRVEPDPGQGGDGRSWASSRRSTGCRWCRPRRDVATTHRRGAGRRRGCSNRPRPIAMSERSPDSASRRLFRPAQPRRRGEARAAFAELREALARGEVRAAEPDAGAAERLAGQRLGQAGHPARLPLRRASSTCPLDHGTPSVLRQGHAAAEAARRAARRAHRPGRLLGARRRLPRAAASSACRRCTSTSAPTSATAR